MRSYAWARRFPASCPCLGKCLNLALPRPSNFLVPVLSIPVTVREAQEASLWLPRGVSKKKTKRKKTTSIWQDIKTERLAHTGINAEAGAQSALLRLAWLTANRY